MRATYTQIRAFNAVAREGGFLRAAERLPPDPASYYFAGSRP